MFELSNILIFGAGGVCGAFLGVLLGRRSMTANKIVDQIKAEYESRIARMKANRQAED